MSIRTIILPLVTVVAAGSLCSPAMAAELPSVNQYPSSTSDLREAPQVLVNQAAASSPILKTRSGAVVVSEDEKDRIEMVAAGAEWANQLPGVSLVFTEMPASELELPSGAEGEVDAFVVTKKRWFGFEIILSRSETRTIGDSYAACNGGIGAIMAGAGALIGGPVGAAVGAGIAAVGCAAIWVAAKHAVNSDRCLKFKMTRPLELPGTPVKFVAVMHPGTCVQD